MQRVAKDFIAFTLHISQAAAFLRNSLSDPNLESSAMLRIVSLMMLYLVYLFLNCSRGVY